MCMSLRRGGKVLTRIIFWFIASKENFVRVVRKLKSRRFNFAAAALTGALFVKNKYMGINIFKKYLLESIYSPKKFKNEYAKMDKLFEISPDSWNFQKSKYEANRFKLMKSFVESIKPNTVLEIGCAEGDFTKILSGICRNLLATDISRIALDRAKKVNPGVKFILSDFTEDKSLLSKSFDLVVASEVLYYVPEPKLFNFLRGIKTKHLLTSNAWIVFRRVEKIIARCGYVKIDNKFLFRMEGLNPKGTNISLWRKL